MKFIKKKKKTKKTIIKKMKFLNPFDRFRNAVSKNISETIRKIVLEKKHGLRGISGI